MRSRLSLSSEQHAVGVVGWGLFSEIVVVGGDEFHRKRRFQIGDAGCWPIVMMTVHEQPDLVLLPDVWTCHCFA